MDTNDNRKSMELLLERLLNAQADPATLLKELNVSWVELSQLLSESGLAQAAASLNRHGELHAQALFSRHRAAIAFRLLQIINQSADESHVLKACQLALKANPWSPPADPPTTHWMNQRLPDPRREEVLAYLAAMHAFPPAKKTDEELSFPKPYGT